MANIVKYPEKIKAIELYATQPDITANDVALKCGVPVKIVYKWREDPNFIEAIYDRYMVEFGSHLPSVLTAMVREAQAGNIQAGRLVLEHSGKLVKNINVTIDSPFEKFLKKSEHIEDAELVEDDEIIELVQDLPIASNLPPRVIENQKKRAKKEVKVLKGSIDRQEYDDKKKQYNEKQKEWYKWRKRAKEVGISPLKGKRPTPGQRKGWQDKIIAAEEANR